MDAFVYPQVGRVSDEREVSLLTALEQTREDAVKSVTNAPDTLSSMRQYSLSVLAIASSRGKNQSKVSQK